MKGKGPWTKHNIDNENVTEANNSDKSSLKSLNSQNYISEEIKSRFENTKSLLFVLYKQRMVEDQNTQSSTAWPRWRCFYGNLFSCSSTRVIFHYHRSCVIKILWYYHAYLSVLYIHVHWKNPTYLIIYTQREMHLWQK